MLVSQVARVHSVVWEKSQDIVEALEGMRQQACAAPAADAATEEAARTAGAFVIAKRLIGQGEMLVDKQPGMAYAQLDLARLGLTWLGLTWLDWA
jgi:hypothetical protein